MPKLRVGTALARVLASVADSGQQLESTAAGILAIVKDHKINTVKAWDEVVEAAYEANGWNTRPGRPNGTDTPKEPVPETVSQYVSIVRKALTAKMRVMKYDSFTALRTAMAKRNGRRDHRGRQSQTLRLPPPLEANFVDVEVAKPDMNGALFHDLAVVWSRLPAEPQALLGRQLAQLLHKYLPMVEAEGAKRKAA